MGVNGKIFFLQKAYVAQCSNKILYILARKPAQKQFRIDSHELMILVGCLFIMAWE